MPNSLTPDELSSMENTKKTQAEVDAVKVALEGLQHDFRYFKEPTIVDISLRAGKPPTVVEPILYRLAKDTGWKPQENPEKRQKTLLTWQGGFAGNKKANKTQLQKSWRLKR